MKEQIQTLLSIAEGIPELLLHVHSFQPGISLYMLPHTGEYLFEESGKGALFADGEPADKLEFPLTIMGERVTKNVLLTYLRIAESEFSKSQTLAIALEGLYEIAHKN